MPREGRKEGKQPEIDWGWCFSLSFINIHFRLCPLFAALFLHFPKGHKKFFSLSVEGKRTCICVQCHKNTRCHSLALSFTTPLQWENPDRRGRVAIYHDRPSSFHYEHRPLGTTQMSWRVSPSEIDVCQRDKTAVIVHTQKKKREERDRERNSENDITSIDIWS